MGIFIITLVGAGIVAGLGLWSARTGSDQLAAKKKMERMQKRAGDIQSSIKAARETMEEDNEKNKDNPDAMLMAAGAHPRR